jgi:phage terminase small subunit
MRTAKRLLRRDGPTISNRFGDVKANPAVSGERSARQGMVSTLRQMNIDLKAVERPPVAMRRAKVEEEKSNVASLELVRSIIRGNR